MKKTKRIHVNKNDEAAAVAEKLIDAAEENIIISVPKFSKLAESLTNFKLLKREAEILKKNIVVESIDDEVADLCKKVKIEIINPFFVKSKKQFSDIIAGEPSEEPRQHNITIEKNDKDEKKEEEENETEPQAKEMDRKRIRLEIPNIRIPKILPRKKAAWGVLLVMVVGGGLAIRMLPNAEVSIVREKSPWRFEGNISASKEVAEIDAEKNIIPGQIFTQKNSLQLFFPATGKDDVERKAKGTLTIVNEHSTAAQPLVVRTRFETPDGKIYRLTKAITVPGAKQESGKLLPSSIKAEVEADEPGEEYNIGPVSKFTIPGFAGSDKFKTFYASSGGNMTGGTVGFSAVPTQEDIEKAKIAMHEKVKNAITTALRIQLPKEFTLIEGSSAFTITNEQVDESVNNQNEFTVLTEGEISVVVFRDSDLRQLLLTKGRAEVGERLVVKDEVLHFGIPEVSLAKGILQIPIEYESRFVHDINVASLEEEIAGKSSKELASIIQSLPGLEKTDITLWPFWVRKVPKNNHKISINLD
ncbi:MAG: hypothetical protein COU08_02595 [Candidatus Harrisonbacteria bacterium CG10_big_fil_rev_8_21_14_0_10_42_17]|uniref:GlxA-like beta barrel domain-containing protein n=1 Tax=Candidatus Harrisonbacteria bacterium CG10_big_fil_rev_8_21_14_0_10_42_17 TaxID=1974584 RepID=A0A2M6WHU2_9BACT|nr:MAG: hypothetical protein COU08_02595 [Candidatus Harrisonbacteria bacterium CG10_big_fil_rev_8_21_14_0_10_42_17]